MATVTHNVCRFDRGGATSQDVFLTAEAPLQITINNALFATTLRTPGNDIALVRGLLHAEALLRGNPDLAWEEIPDPETGYTANIRVQVAPERLARPVDDLRALTATASCGICGTRRVEDVLILGDPIRLPKAVRLSTSTLHRLFEALYANQPTFGLTGGSHAAALATTNGELLTTHEDVGRHNAVDKAVGTLLQRGTLEEAAALLVSGRISYEIIAKAYRAAVPIVAAVSAPSSMAVEYGQRLGLTVLGFCRDDRISVYTHGERISGGAPAGRS